MLHISRCWVKALILVITAAFFSSTEAQTPELDRLWSQERYKGLTPKLLPLATAGDKIAQYRLGVVLLEGLDGKAQPASALNWLRKAAAQGYARAEWREAIAELYGQDGVPKVPAKAWPKLLDLAQRGDAYAQNDVGVVLESGWNADGLSVALDLAAAVDWYRKAAEQGDADAQNNLGLMLADGRGVAKNEAEAVQWYRKAAEQGNADAQTNLGAMLANGRGVAKNEAEAVQWFRKAAEQGNAWGQNNLAVHLEAGRGMLQNQAEANRWFAASARNGDGYGQRNWANNLRHGQGVAVDFIRAYAWLNLASVAASNPHPDAAKERDELAVQLSREQLAEGQRLSAQWRQGKDLPPPNPRVAAPRRVEAPVPVAPAPVETSAATDPFPARPAKRPGVVSCNTRCVNADCWRTYDDGRKVKLRAKQQWNPLQNSFEWNAGPC